MELVHALCCWINEHESTILKIEQAWELGFELLAETQMLLLAHENTKSIQDLVSSSLCQTSSTFDYKSLED